MELEKQGSSLAAFEQAIKSGNLEKTAGVGDAASALWEMLKIYGASAVGAGAVGGLGLYGGYKALQDTNKKQRDADIVKQRLVQAQQELQDRLSRAQSTEQYGA